MNPNRARVLRAALLAVALVMATSSTVAASGADDRSPAPKAARDRYVTIPAGGVPRHFLLHVPRNATGRGRLPLVLMLHGHGSTAKGFAKGTAMNATADAAGFYVAYLEGTKGSTGGQAWNSGISPALQIGVDDVAFVRAVVARLQKQHHVDPRRVYAAGFSNGAFMTHRLAAELPGLLAAVAVVAGTVGTYQDDGELARIPDPKSPVPVLIIHGEQDPAVRYDGGQGAGPIDALPVADAVDLWTRADGCVDSPTPTPTPDGKVVVTGYTQCDRGTEVRLFTLVDGTHQWPTLQNQSRLAANDAIWEFFSRHRLR